jgi:hypothetical protein
MRTELRRNFTERRDAAKLRRTIAHAEPRVQAELIAISRRQS